MSANTAERRHSTCNRLFQRRFVVDGADDALVDFDPVDHRLNVGLAERDRAERDTLPDGRLNFSTASGSVATERVNLVMMRSSAALARSRSVLSWWICFSGRRRSRSRLPRPTDRAVAACRWPRRPRHGVPRPPLGLKRPLSAPRIDRGENLGQPAGMEQSIDQWSITSVPIKAIGTARTWLTALSRAGGARVIATDCARLRPAGAQGHRRPVGATGSEAGEKNGLGDHPRGDGAEIAALELFATLRRLKPVRAIDSLRQLQESSVVGRRRRGDARRRAFAYAARRLLPPVQRSER